MSGEIYVELDPYGPVRSTTSVQKSLHIHRDGQCVRIWWDDEQLCFRLSPNMGLGRFQIEPSSGNTVKLTVKEFDG